jgi:hypothetical protein
LSGSLAVLSVVLLLGGASPAAAGGPLPAAEAGVHYLVDKRVHPGAACIYSRKRRPNRLLEMRVGAPVVFAADRRPGRVDRQLIGWRFVIRSDSGVRYRSAIRTAYATDRVPADLTAREWKVSGIGYWSTVMVKVYWYRRGRLVAKARMEPHFYRYRPMGTVFTGGCSAI